jgi:hypothetical protein
VPIVIKVSLTPSTAQFSSDIGSPLTIDATATNGTKRAPFQRTLDDAGGGHKFRGGTT